MDYSFKRTAGLNNGEANGQVLFENKSMVNIKMRST